MIKLFWPVFIIFLKKVNSTNQYARKCNFKKKNWIIIWSLNQTKGIGSGKNFWNTKKNENLTFSIIFKPINPLDIRKQYIINTIVSNGIHKALLEINDNKHNKKFWIKWPNDIFSFKKKVGGILIENSIFFKKIHTSIIGIGLNVNQTEFEKKWNASSLKKILSLDFKLNDLLYKIIYFIQNEYLYFLIYGENYIRKYYIKYLYLKDKISFFYIFKSKKIFKGVIRSVTDQGFLIVEFNKKFYFFRQKEIKFIEK
ncbi:biotin--[acetyl-CoA-carboxylase] ligase [Blattabacterium cuenoti]|uniref:biotin--[acetyl-CoA-carboxylase] ligase n=1 Tax=Blattabacterium cuenoti TaxID=1653831 RepID=UPI00163C7571|nr:biotin--[acetyl-CoA-carboxylase] ligase [Blattabacterium cuenoti]